MSVLIVGFKLPENGFKDIRIFSDGTVSSPSGEKPYYRLFAAQELPDQHGDLIDADSLKASLKDHIAIEDDEKLRDQLEIITDFYIGAETAVIYAEKQ